MSRQSEKEISNLISDHPIKEKIRFMKVTAFIGIPVITGFITDDFLAGRFKDVFFLLPMLLPLIILLILLKKLTNKRSIELLYYAVFYFFFLFFCAYIISKLSFTGDLSQLPWLYIISFLTFIIFGHKKGLALTIVLSLILIFMFYINTVPLQVSPVDLSVRFLISILIITISLYLIERRREKYKKQLIDNQIELLSSKNKLIASNAELESSEKKYRLITETSIDVIFQLDHQGNVTYANNALDKMFGASPNESVGMHFIDFVHQDDHSKALELFKALQNGDVIKTDLKAKHKNKNGFPILLSVVPTLSEEKLIAVTGMIRDITQMKENQDKLAKSVMEKEILLREVHHRVKNNMQTIISMMNLSARNHTNPKLNELFSDFRNKIEAMSLIHELLYQSEDISRIDFKQYLRKLCNGLMESYREKGKNIALTLGSCNGPFDIEQSLSLGMLITELVSNSMKHAFPLKRKGNIMVELFSENNTDFTLTVQDNGCGIQSVADPKKTSLGLRLIYAIAERELGGNLKIESDNGTKTSIFFKKKVYE